MQVSPKIFKEWERIVKENVNPYHKDDILQMKETGDIVVVLAVYDHICRVYDYDYELEADVPWKRLVYADPRDIVQWKIRYENYRQKCSLSDR